MKKRIFKIAISLIVCGQIMSIHANHYFSYKNKKRLYLKEDVFFIQMKKNNRKMGSLKTSLMKKRILLNKIDDIQAISNSLMRLKLKTKLQELKRKKLEKELDIRSIYPVYENEEGIELGMTDKICVKFNDDYTNKEIDDLIARYPIKIFSQRKKRFVFTVEENKGADPIIMSSSM